MTDKLVHAKKLIHFIISFIVTSSNNSSILKIDACKLTNHKYNENEDNTKYHFTNMRLTKISELI